MIVLESERLLIRQLRMDDIDMLMKLQNNPKVTKYLSYDNWSKERCISNLYEWRKKYEEDNSLGVWAVELIESSETIGLCALIKTGGENQLEIIFRILPDYWGYGIGSEMAAYLVKYAFEKLNVKSVIGITAPKNMATRRVFIKLNFKEDLSNCEEEGAKYTLFNPSISNV